MDLFFFIKIIKKSTKLAKLHTRVKHLAHTLTENRGMFEINSISSRTQGNQKFVFANQRSYFVWMRGAIVFVRAIIFFQDLSLVSHRKRFTKIYYAFLINHFQH